VKQRVAKPGEKASPPPERAASVVTVLVIDDQPVFRDLTRLVLRTTPGFESVGEISSGEEALEVIGERMPQLVIVDVSMPGMGGIETARRIAAAHPDIVVVLISIEDLVDVPSAAHACGAAALVRKQDFGATLLRHLWETYGAK
jgi:two-component system, NarL family, invasion response regulator UvrY